MDFQTIDNYMKGTGLANDPAFENLHFLNEPIPPMEKKTILGLYFPEGEEPQNQYGYLPPSTIILPPDADLETLRHELGHRHGHYYYGDISEEYAENYRKAHGPHSYAARMRPVAQTTEWQQVAQGNQTNITSLSDYESQLAEGQNARVDFNFITPVPTFQVDALRSTLSFAGVTNLQVVSIDKTIHIYYTKDPWWLPIIIIAVLAIAILLISWFFFKEVVKTTGPVGGTALIIGGALALGLLTFAVIGGSNSKRRVST